MPKAKGFELEPQTRVDLRKFDPDDTGIVPGDKEKTQRATEKLVLRIGELQELLYAENVHRLLIVLQGMDTSGKDSTIRKLLREVSPQGVHVASFKKPTTVELDHDYLWRVHAVTPGRGQIVVFNRSQYEDVLVVRVHGLVPNAEWKARYRQINEFERHLAENGTTILKFFLHISAEEQKKRLQERVDDPTKRWKFQHGDLDERKLWNEYQRVYEDALSLTSTKFAPWYVIPANRKWVRNWAVASTVARALERLKMTYPNPDLGDPEIT